MGIRTNLEGRTVTQPAASHRHLKEVPSLLQLIYSQKEKGHFLDALLKSLIFKPIR